MLDALEDLSLLENTLVVFFSDNGGPPTNGAWNLPLAGSKFTLWEGGIRVPFILSRPGDPYAGEIWDKPISTLDVLPTCLDAAGIAVPEALDGEVIPKTAKEMDPHRELFWRLRKDSYAARVGDWKLLVNGGKVRTPTSGIINREDYLKGLRLFNLREDPSESRDVAKEHPEIVQRIQSLYASWSKRVVGSHSGGKGKGKKEKGG